MALSCVVLQSSGALVHDLRERDHLNYTYTAIAWTARSVKDVVASKRGRKDLDLGTIALGTSTGEIVLWDLKRGEVVLRLTSETCKDAHTSAVNDLVFNHNSKLLFSCANEKNALQWKLTEATVTKKFRCSGEGAQKIAVTADCTVLAVAGSSIRTYSLPGGKKQRKLSAGLSSNVNQMYFSPCKRFLFTSTVGARFVNMYDFSLETDEPAMNFSMPSSSSSLFLRVNTIILSKSDVLLGAVATTGSLCIWTQKYKKGSKSTKPVTPVVKSVVKDDIAASAGILAAELVKDESNELVIVRGSTVKPVFEKVALVDEQNEFKQELAFEAVSEHLLLGDSESAAKKRKVEAEAAFKEKTHVLTLSERTGTASAKDVVDASGFEELEDASAEEEDGEELTLAERVEALREHVEGDLAAELERVEAAEQEQATVGTGKPDASSLSSVLEQALQTKDNAMLEYCLRTHDAKIIGNTIKRVSSVKVLQLLDVLVIKFEKSPARCSRLCPWIRAILLHHTAYLMTQPDLVQNLSALYQILENRLKVHDQLQKLAGRLSLVIGQIHEASSHRGADNSDASRAKLVYREGRD